ncbi:hypothetical protein PIIN_10071 [Serendipita indica DSM 11827]|uniref:Uncharacterized protein n=1 Tax=Serendipita indica (strain DSM 11827) TaxID=1109443 RepID=G4TXM8_SERID|nr:hypothetical protein PIIN_10071 [Serendipita indica DSM 11827]
MLESRPDTPVQGRLVSSHHDTLSKPKYTKDRLPTRCGGGGRIARPADADVIPASYSGLSTDSPREGKGVSIPWQEPSGTRPLNRGGRARTMPRANQVTGLPKPQAILDRVRAQKHWGHDVYKLLPEWESKEIDKEWKCRWRRSIVPGETGRVKWSGERQCKRVFRTRGTWTRHVTEHHMGIRRHRKSKGEESRSPPSSPEDEQEGSTSDK